MSKRLGYLMWFIVLVGIEFVIGIFVHDNFIRPYVGDVIIVWVLYTFVKVFAPEKWNSYIIAVAILIFSFIVEFLQLIHIVDILGIENNFLRVLIGTSFSTRDLLCYTIGTVIICMINFMSELASGKKVHIGRKE